MTPRKLKILQVISDTEISGVPFYGDRRYAIIAHIVCPELGNNGSMDVMWDTSDLVRDGYVSECQFDLRKGRYIQGLCVTEKGRDLLEGRPVNKRRT